jgi:hypothetical protein
MGIKVVSCAALCAIALSVGACVKSPSSSTTKPTSFKNESTSFKAESNAFTTENVMNVHQGMDSNEILKMFGAPQGVRQAVCGAATGKSWSCITWEYGKFPYDRASFTFAADSGSLILNNFDVQRK